MLRDAESSDDVVADYEETTQLTIFTPLISFLVVLISFLSLLALIAFVTNTGRPNINICIVPLNSMTLEPHTMIVALKHAYKAYNLLVQFKLL